MSAYDIEGSPTIGEFLKCDAFQQILMGPFGSGKSSAAVNKLAILAAEQEPWPDGVVRVRTAVIRNTYPQLKDTTISTWMDWFDPQKGWGEYNTQNHNYRMRFKREDGAPVEFEIRFRALDRPDQVSNLLSAEFTNAWCNESRELPLAVWDALCGRVDRYPPRKEVSRGAVNPCVIGDTNPPDTDHWQYRRFEEHLAPDGRTLTPEEVADLAIFKQPSGRSAEAENLRNLPEDYYRRLAAGKAADFVRVYVDGLYGYVMEGKPVYPEYNDQIHCREFEVDPRWPVYRGWDFGLSPASVFTCLTPSGQWRIFDEVVAQRMGARNLAREVQQRITTDWKWMRERGEDIGDPAGATPSESEERSCFDVLASEGFMITPGEQTIERRLDAVRTRLTTMIDGEPALVLHPRCRVLRKGFQGGYQYRRLKVSGERFTDTPDKNEFSHPHDGLQYVGTRLFAFTGKPLGFEKPRVIRSV